MTCIIALRDSGKVLLAADSCTTLDSHVESIGDKLFWCGEFLVGGAGDVLMLQYIQHALQLRKMKRGERLLTYAAKELGPKVSEIWEQLKVLEEDIWGEFIFATKGECVTLTARGEVFSSVREYMAIGSGATFALGSLRNSRGKAEDRALQAINTAAEFLGDVAPPVIMEWT